MVIRFQLGVVLILCLYSSSVGAQSNDSLQATWVSSPSDLYALQQLWNVWQNTPDVQTNLAGWNALDNDTQKKPCVPDSPWRGVFCNARLNATAQTNASALPVWDLDIVGLLLTNASLTGTIPAAIGNLSNLVTISLTNNPDLTGPLPKELDTLYSLYSLDVHGNNITGEIPNWNRDAFVFCQNMNLGDNKMTGGLPTNETNSFHAVQTFNISYNLFSGDFVVVDLFNYFDKAVSVDVSHNQFSGAMPYLVNFTLDGITEEITGPLSYLDISSNKFNQTLTKLSGHKTLQFLNVSYNELTDSLDPVLMTDVPTLTTLDISYNLFTGSIPNLAALTNLQYLDLSYNNFNPGPFPNWTTEIYNLHTLNLQGVSLTGDIPSTVLASFNGLRYLALDDNNLTGTLDINGMLAVHNGSQNLQTITLTNNKINSVAYSGRMVNLAIKFNLKGNPYCDNSTSASDLKRCVCQQQCADTPGAPGNRAVIIIAGVICGSLLAVFLLVGSLLLWQSRRERYQLILGAEKKFAEYEVKPTIYTFGELQVITRNFSTKLGQGAFGTVYKGTILNGSEVAVKQLYTKSNQSLDDFLNEIVVVAAVKHRNLVKLKGCCIRKNQRLLVYEFVENGDLDQFLFGQESIGKDSWSIRKKICYGVAEGIHYLHFASQPKIIHRDIKACNILLDKNLEPKIADFGLALLYPEEESHIMTIHVAGTRGYLAPEYAHLGQLSDKVDVFSYGVLLLEIVSKRRNIELKSPESDHFYLPEWAWTLFNEGRIKELIDPSLDLQPREETEAMRIINIALLCVHSSGERRPDMKGVLAMLHGGMDAEVASLVLEHESERFRPYHRSGLSHTDSGTSSGTSSLLNRGYPVSTASAFATQSPG
uniref:Leucine-rich repeat receptor-like protein kinase n=1 Tax=Pohlia nutans TaxID=140635 RepID=A0A1P8DYV4_9BRYO|nr:leucine-rich repeat receptor-like protein kinase [Pohlia nutans]